MAPLVPLAGCGRTGAGPGRRACRSTALALLAVALLVDNPGERPAEGRWQSPLFALVGELLYENLHKHTGIGALRFSALEAVIRAAGGCCSCTARSGAFVWMTRTASARFRIPMKVAFGVFLATLVGLEVYGLARGGDFKNSLWQARQLFWLPVLGCGVR